MRHVWMMILFFQRSLSDHFNLVYPHDPVVADLGSNVTLLCSTKPSMDLENMEVEWIRPDLNKAVVHRYKDKQDKTADQNSNYTGRTELFKEALKWGNTSLLLKNVKVSDEGRYTCGVQGNGVYRTNTFNVTVRAIGPRISVLSSDGSGEIRLQCESTGWQSEPKLQWMDSEGKVLSTGKTDLHNDGFMRSNITVRRSDSSCCFICSVSSGENKQKAEMNISGIGTTPVINVLGTDDSGGIQLRCYSQGWLHVPELQWLNSKKKELTTGETESNGGDVKVISVSLEITVYRSNANKYYCRVNEHREMETHIDISDFLVDPHGPVVADLGYDIILPCSIKPSIDYVIKEVQWIRLDLNKTVVHRYNTTVDYQDPEYRGRTELFKQELQWGNTSLLLKNVKESDEGRYTCGVQTQDAYDIITLDVIKDHSFNSWKWAFIILAIVVITVVIVYVIRKKFFRFGNCCFQRRTFKGAQGETAKFTDAAKPEQEMEKM